MKRIRVTLIQPGLIRVRDMIIQEDVPVLTQMALIQSSRGRR